MHLKSLRLLIIGVLTLFVFGVYALPVFAKAPSMSEYFRYDQVFAQSNSQIDRDIFVLPTVSVIGQPVKDSVLKIERPDLEPRHKTALGIEVKVVTEIGPQDVFTTLNLAGPAELVQKLQNTTQIGGVNVYIKSGLSWEIRNEWTVIAPCVRGRFIGLAIRYKVPRM